MLVVGSERMLERQHIVIPEYIAAIQAHCYERGRSLIYAAQDGNVIGAISLAPSIRTEAPAIIAALQRQEREVVIVSGDHQQVTHQIAEVLGVDAYHAEVLPDEKADLIQKLQQNGRSVCFVGDGINDALALKQANVSISLRGASTLAVDTAHILLLDNRIEQIPILFDLANDLQRHMQRNLVISIVPGLGTIGAVYLFHAGIVLAYVLFYASFGIGLLNASLPLLTHKYTQSPTQRDHADSA